MQIIFDDKDLEELIFREFDGGIRITVLDLDDTHYGNKKWKSSPIYGGSSGNDD